MDGSGSDGDIFDDPDHMSCEEFVFPVSQVGLPDRNKSVHFCFGKVDHKNQVKMLRPKNEFVYEKEEEKSGKDAIVLDDDIKKRPVPKTRDLFVT